MRSRIVSLARLYLKSTFSFSLPTAAELKKPKILLKVIGVALLAVLLLMDFGFIFVMSNLNLYDSLAPAGLQGIMLLNAATTASILVFILAFLMALSLFSTSSIEAGFVALPIPPREFLAAKMFVVYVTEALLGFFVLAVAMVIYGIKEHAPFMLYVNGTLTAAILPLFPTALAYLLLIPMMNASKMFRNKNFLLYVGGAVGILFALGFNYYLQMTMAGLSNPERFASFVGPDSFISTLGKAWPPSWLTWVALSKAASFTGFLAVLGNAAIGAATAAAVVFLLDKSYVRSLQAFGETTLTRSALKLSAAGSRHGAFSNRPALYSLALREIRLMNREPMYMLNGPFVVILMPLVFVILFLAQREALAGMQEMIAPILAGPYGFLIPAGLGAFIGSMTSIACTSVSRDAKAIAWMKAMPISSSQFFLAKLIHAELFSVFGIVVGCGAGFAILKPGIADAAVSVLLALLFSLAFNMGGLWLDAATPRLRWDNPIAALKQNPNSVIMILGAMTILAALGFATSLVSLPKFGYAALLAAVFAIPIAAWLLLFPEYAKRRYESYEV